MEILNWLKGGGALFGQRTGLDRRLHLLPHQGRARGPFGLWTRYLGISPRGMACLAGVEETCRAIFLRPGRERDSWRLGPWSIQSEMGATPVDFFGSRFLGLDSDLGSLDEYVLDLLEQDFGRDRFRTFWQSSLPVPDAFQSAFGVSPEHWIMKLGRSHFGSMDRGPGVPLQASLLTLLTLGTLLGAASRAGRYRS